MGSSSKRARLSLAARLLACTSMGTLGVLLATPVSAQTELPAIQVQGDDAGAYNAQTPALGKLTEALIDTPNSVDTITRQVIDDRGAATLNDALRNAPGITLGAGEFNWQGNNPYIHGFQARTDMFIDGMRDIGNYYRDTFDLEKVEVLEGPDSVLFGRGSTGGVINQVSKQAGLNAFTNFSVAGGTADTRRASADVNMPIDGLDTPAAVRVNIMGSDSGVAGRDVVQNQHYGIAPTLALGIGTPTRLDIGYFHESENDIPDYGLPWYFGNPAPVARNNYYGYRSDYLKNDTDIGTLKAEHDFSPDLTIREQLRYAAYTLNERETQPRLPATATLATPLSSITVTNQSYSRVSLEDEFENNTDVLAHVDTGPLRHDIVAGFEYDTEGSAPRFYNASGLTNALVTPNTELAYNPTATYARVFAKTDTHTTAFYGVDTVKLGEAWQLVGGVRYDSFHTRYAQTTFSVPPAAINVVTGSINTTHVDNVVSYRGALVYKPAENGTVYFSYGTSFNPSAEFLTLLTSAETFAVGNLNLKPEKNSNAEVGTKWALLDNRLNLNASLFRAQKTNARVPDAANPGFNQLAGDQRVDGAEIVAQGQITEDWNISTGYDWLDSNTIKTVTGGPAKGWALPLTPKHQVTLWTTYMITPDLQIGGGGNFLTKRYARGGTAGSATLPEVAPGYVTFDAMAKYRLSEKFDAQLNVYNIGDKYYFDTLHPNFVIPGAGRSAMLTLNFHY